MKQILLSKNHDITEFASKDRTRPAITGVHYNAKSQCLEAIDGQILIRVPVVQVEGEFPPVKTALDKEPIDCIIPIAPFKKALGNIPKSNVPACEHVKLDANGAVTLTTTDLDTEQAITCKPIEGEYPKFDVIIPAQAPTLSIGIAPGVLRRVVDYALKHATGKNQTIRFDFIDSLSPIRFSVGIDTMAGEQKATGTLMPVRLL